MKLHFAEPILHQGIQLTHQKLAWTAQADDVHDHKQPLTYPSFAPSLCASFD